MKIILLFQSRITPLSKMPTSGLFCKDATHIIIIINRDHNINNNNIYIVVYSQHPYCCVNNFVLTLFLKQ